MNKLEKIQESANFQERIRKVTQYSKENIQKEKIILESAYIWSDTLDISFFMGVQIFQYIT